MMKLEIITLKSTKKFEIIIDLNESITFEYLLEYLSYGYPKENFCPCFQFINYKKTKYFKKDEKVIDFIGTNKNKFYIANTESDKKCHCSNSLKIYYSQTKSEIINTLNEIMKNYNEIFDEMSNEINKLKEEKNNLEKLINDPVLIDQLKKFKFTTTSPIIINESLNKKNFVDFYDVIIDIKSIKDINNGWEIKMNDKGMQNYEKYNKTKNLKIGVIGNSNKGKSFLLSKISKIDLPSGTSIRTEGLSIKYPDLENYKDRK